MPKNLRDLFLLSAAASALLVACAVQSDRYQYPLRSTSAEKAPAGWSTVRVIEASSRGASAVAVSVPPTEALGRALIRRVGEDGARTRTLRIEDVRLSEQVDGDAIRLGLGASFVLRDEKGAEQKLALEHSLTTFETDDLERDVLYTRVIDELVDRLLYHRQAIAFVGAQPAEWKDPMLASGDEIGPVQPVESSQGVEGTGRLLWGDSDRADFFMGTVIVGETMGGFFNMSQRRSAGNFGYRWSLGAGGLKVQDSAAFMFMAGAGLELGLWMTVHSDQGYVDRPGLSVMLVPQVMSMQMMIPGDTLTQITALTFGGALEADLPITSFLGVTGSVFLGGSLAAMTAGSFSNLAGPTFVWYPTGDVYLQTSSGRFSLGLAFQALSDPEQLFKNPQIVFTFQSRVGRGMAYSKQNLEAFDWGVHSQVDVMSSPKSAFVNPETERPGWTPVPGTEGSKIAFVSSPAPVAVAQAQAPILAAPTAAGVTPPAGTLNGGASPAAPGSASPTQVPRARWVLVQPDLAGFDPGEDAVVEMVAGQALTDSGQDVVPKDRLQATLQTLGLATVEDTSRVDLAGALGASHLLRVRMKRDQDSVTFELRSDDVGARVAATVTGSIPRQSMLRVLREKAKELASGGGDRQPWSSVATASAPVTTQASAAAAATPPIP
ncbi:MAG: hypothetical protein IT384_27645 [Deltaproteobacteria bacterium]|nr:hypothetical protein [Deltaproteobacteria bacterium]